MATLTVQDLNLSGVDVTLAAAAAIGDEFVNDGDIFYKIANGSGADITVTGTAQTQCNHGFDHDAQVTVPAGDTLLIGPFAVGRFNDADGKVQMSYSLETSITVAAVRLPPAPRY